MPKKSHLTTVNKLRSESINKGFNLFNGLDVKTMRLFIAAADGGNLTYAAHINHIALGAASRRISNFELQMGEKLLERHARGVLLTSTGQVVADKFRNILELLNNLGKLSPKYGSHETKLVRLIANGISIIEFLPNIVKKIKDENPNIDIEMQEFRSWETEHALRHDYARIAFISKIDNSDPIDGFYQFEFDRQPVVLVVDNNHPLAKKNSVKIADVLDFEFIGLPPASILFTSVREEARRLGKVLRIPIVVSSHFHACHMVSNGFGITVVPKIIANKMKKSLGLIAIELEDELKTFRTMIYHAEEEKMTSSEVKLLHYLKTISKSCKKNFQKK